MLIALFKGRGLISALIRWQTRGTYSHAAIITGLRPLTIIEAWQGSGVRQKSLGFDLKNIDFFALRKEPNFSTERAITFACAQLGFPYDYRGVFRFVTRVPAHINSKWFCSELVHEAVRVGGMELLQRESSEVAPEHLSWSTKLIRISRSELEAMLYSEEYP